VSSRTRPHSSYFFAQQILQNAPNVLGKLDMDGFFLKWYPILSGLSRVVIDSPSLAIRKKGTCETI